MNWRAKYAYFGPFLLAGIFPVAPVVKTKRWESVTHVSGKGGSGCELSSQLQTLVPCVPLTPLSNLGISLPVVPTVPCYCALLQPNNTSINQQKYLLLAGKPSHREACEGRKEGVV